MAEVNISYDLLFDVLRYEKSKEEIQAIDSDFYKNVFDYLQIKESSMLNSQTPVSERELIRIQLNNVKKLLNELYERREKKIINLALYKLKTDSQTINTSALLPEEKPLFEAIYAVLNKYRDSVIVNLLNSKSPISDMMIFGPQKPSAVSQSSSEFQSALTKRAVFVDDPDKEIRSIRFIKSVPKFLGPELETYGPFEQDEIASLPSDIAKILVNKERAEEIKIE